MCLDFDCHGPVWPDPETVNDDDIINTHINLKKTLGIPLPLNLYYVCSAYFALICYCEIKSSLVYYHIR